MKRNVGPKERYGRLAIGILSGAGAIFLPASAAVRVVLGIVGVAGLGTGTSRYCPVNQALGVDNYEKGLLRQATAEKEKPPKLKKAV